MLDLEPPFVNLEVVVPTEGNLGAKLDSKLRWQHYSVHGLLLSGSRVPNTIE